MKFMKDFMSGPNAKDDQVIEPRYGWGFSSISSKRFKMLKDDPNPTLLEITDIPYTAALEPYAIVSDYAKYAITVAHQHIKDLMKEIYPGIELDIPDWVPKRYAPDWVPKRYGKSQHQ